MLTMMKKYFNHYQLIYLFAMILFGSGFLLALILKLCNQPLLIFFPQFFNQIITVDLIQSYLYFMLCLILILILCSFHIFGVVLIGIITFLLGIHTGNYSAILFDQSLYVIQHLWEQFFILSQSASILILIIGAIEMAINVFAVTFIFKERLKPIDLMNHWINYSFISCLILFVTIILKIYVN